MGYSAVTGAAPDVTSEPVPRQPKLTTRALWAYHYDPALQVTVRHVYGYRAECSCEWTSDKARTVALARFYGACHLAEEHP